MKNRSIIDALIKARSRALDEFSKRTEGDEG